MSFFASVVVVIAVDICICSNVRWEPMLEPWAVSLNIEQYIQDRQIKESARDEPIAWGEGDEDGVNALSDEEKDIAANLRPSCNDVPANPKGNASEQQYEDVISTSITLSAPTALNVNLTRAMADGVSNSLQLLSTASDHRKLSARESRGREPFSFFRLDNATELPLMCSSAGSKGLRGAPFGLHVNPYSNVVSM